MTAATTTVTCSAGGTGSLTVPAAATSAQVTLKGAGGGPSTDGIPGGKGAQVVATLAVTPGSTLNAAVGSQGTTVPGYPGYGGFGGGLVAVTTPGGTPLLTAGSGGGAGGRGYGTPSFPGTPGGDSASAGSPGNGDATRGGGQGGGPGTATAGGPGGAGGTGASPSPGSHAGRAGSFPNAPGGTFSTAFFIPSGGGGNGGAGYGSGGAGGAGGFAGDAGGGGGGGGGGSSLVSNTVPGSPSSVTDGVNAGDGSIVFVFPNPQADIAVDVTATPHLGILVPYLTYTLTARNTGPDAVTSATITAPLPSGTSATNLSPGCTTSAGTVSCAYTGIANGASAGKSFRVPLSLLSLGQVTVTGTRTASAPTDLNPANDRDSATCSVLSIVLVTCP
ncbi:hypothetical protein ACFVZE_25505 [Streptomyces anulatus]|uniref:hypothetical protein n=1 Tax=Streptomyces anulatus TaxID=1892 RepID=UPI0036D9A06F